MLLTALNNFLKHIRVVFVVSNSILNKLIGNFILSKIVVKVINIMLFNLFQKKLYCNSTRKAYTKKTTKKTETEVE